MFFIYIYMISYFNVIQFFILKIILILYIYLFLMEKQPFTENKFINDSLIHLSIGSFVLID